MEETTNPIAKGRQLLIKVHASSINPHDWKYAEFFQSMPKASSLMAPLSLGHDVSGVVVGVGSGVKSYGVGDQVFGMSAKTGAFSDYITIDERMVANKPECLNHAEAASLPMAGLTALQALKLSNVKRNQKILVIGASGGVGSLSVQIAKAKGAIVSGVCSSKNTDFVRELGASDVINYDKQCIPDIGQGPFNVVLDTVGTESMESCECLIESGGFFVTTLPNVKSIADIVTTNLRYLFNRNNQRLITLLAMPVKKHLQELSSLVESGDLIPVIDKTFLFEELEEAIGVSKLGRTRGKLVISIEQ